MSAGCRKELYRQWVTETGVENLTDQQLVEAYLGIANVCCARALSKKLIAHYNTVWNMLTSSVGELSGIQGMNQPTCVLISSTGNIYIRGQAQYELSSAVIAPKHAARLLIPRFRGLETEAVYAIYLDSFLLPLSIDLICTGGADFAHLDIFKMLCMAERAGSDAIIIAHNHPTYDPTPSASDRVVTSQLIESLRPLGICLLDHIVVAKDTFVSMAADGLLDTVDESGHYLTPSDAEEI